MDLAFFIVNFGFSKAEYLDLTEAEKSFVHKEYERKVISDATYIRDAVFNAVNNALRKKGANFQVLFKKKQQQVDKEFNIAAVDLVMAMEEENQQQWVEKVYGTNGFKLMKGGV